MSYSREDEMTPDPPSPGEPRLLLTIRLRRWWHCLTHLHQPVTGTFGFQTTFIGCSCGVAWYTDLDLRQPLLEDFVKEWR